MPRAIIFAAASTLIAYAATAHATPVEKRDFFIGNPADLPCAVRVDFIRAAKGPDYDAWDAMRAYIAESRDIQRAEAWGWRMDGEFILCLQIEDPEAITAVFSDLSKLAPKSPALGVGPTTVALGRLAAR
ncbi:MAG: hypothetical protein ABL901_04790 [Hyphomicrobiaceae bacterium]